MPAAAINHRRQPVTILLKLLGRNVSERTNRGQVLAKNLDAFLAGCSPLVVLTAGMLVLYHRVANHHADTRGEWQEFEFQTAAIQHECVVPAAVAGDELVHDAATH